MVLFLYPRDQELLRTKFFDFMVVFSSQQMMTTCICLASQIGLNLPKSRKTCKPIHTKAPKQDYICKSFQFDGRENSKFLITTDSLESNRDCKGLVWQS